MCEDISGHKPLRNPQDIRIGASSSGLEINQVLSSILNLFVVFDLSDKAIHSGSWVSCQVCLALFAGEVERTDARRRTRWISGGSRSAWTFISVVAGSRANRDVSQSFIRGTADRFILTLRWGDR